VLRLLAALAAVLATALAVDGCRRGGAGGGRGVESGSGGRAGVGVGTGPQGGSDGAAALARRRPRIDVHMHINPDAIDRALVLMDRWGIDGAINLSGMYPGPPLALLETQIQSARAAHGRIAVFANANFKRVARDRDFGKTMAADLVESKRAGAVGLKIPKGLGLGYPAPGGRRLLAVDDPGLGPLFEKAGELGMPVAIHVGDPKAFWKPPTPDNERWDELGAHPEWSFYGQPVPSWEDLYAAFERLVARHKRTTFIGVHFGNNPEDPERVGKMLDTYPNLFIDTAARVPEIGRHSPDKMRRFFERYQDRVLFGTDTGIGPTADEMMYGSTGNAPPTDADEQRFFRSTYRYFESLDRQFESPTPIQGRWKIDGVGLPEKVLRKIYYENAARILRWTPTAAGAPGPTGR
jgi:predicted TIM-barrel fold metal-dependent hydrolase